MVFEIIFNLSLDIPLSYDWGHDKYEACPNCLRAHEVRTCDGETRVSWGICAQHEDAAKDKYFDDTMLNEIRTLIHPLHSPVPTFPVTAAGITATGKYLLGKKVTESVDYQGYRQARPVHARSEWTFVTRPLPKLTYVHAKGCMHSDEPDVVFKSHEQIAEIDAYARERLQNINALLEAGVDYELGPDLGADALANGHACGGESGSTPGARAGEASSSKPSSLGMPSSEQDADSEISLEKAARMTLSRIGSEARALLRAEKKRLEECLATSSLAKGLYFKRCNGQWVSPLADVLPYGKGRQLQVKIKGEIAKEEFRWKMQYQAGKMGYRVKFQEQTQAKPIVMWKIPKKSPYEDTEYQALDAEDEKSALSMITEAMLSSSKMKSSSSVVSSSAASTSATFEFIGHISHEEIFERMCTPSTVLILPMDDTTNDHGYGYALLRPEDAPVLAASLPPYRYGLNERQHFKQCMSKGWPPTFGNHDAHSASFRYMTSMLMAREALVRSGQADAEDLIVTSWGYNRLVRNRFIRMEEAMRKAEAEEGKIADEDVKMSGVALGGA